jgi:uncharacterized protein (TIGR03382 family)
MSRTLHAAVAAASLLVAPAISRADTANASASAPVTLGWLGADPAPASLGAGPRTLLQVIPDPPKAAGPVRKAGEAFVIYMNREGGTYSPGGNDARTNLSSLVQRPTVIPAWNVSDAGWAEVMSCVRDLFEPFDVEITDVDPGRNVPHIESIVAGDPADLSLDPGVGGVSPFTESCSVIPNSIVYTFAEVFGNDFETICEVVAQEAAHSFGLDHQFLAADPMAYLPFDGLRTFQDRDVECGEFAARACGLPNRRVCSQTQNSFEMLSERIGVRKVDGPSVAIDSPSNGATVEPGFAVQGLADSTGELLRVELWVDGALSASKFNGPFSFATSEALAEGQHRVELRAYDAITVATATITVTVEDGPPGTNPGVGGDDGDDAGNGADGDQVTGGCDAGGGAPGVLVALGIYALFRRRRRPHGQPATVQRRPVRR